MGSPAADLELLAEAARLATRSALRGGGPFGAIVVMPSGFHYTGTNEVTRSSDPTAHAEVSAIRSAALSEGFDLWGGVLYSSCAPCPMCYTAALWARLDRVIYAATPEQATAAGFDDAPFWEAVSLRLSSTDQTSLEHKDLGAEAVRSFEMWSSNPQRMAY